MASERQRRRRAAARAEMKQDARFSFPDRRHSFYSEVYPGVSVPSRLISCPSSLPVFRSVSRSASSDSKMMLDGQTYSVKKNRIHLSIVNRSVRYLAGACRPRVLTSVPSFACEVDMDNSVFANKQ